MEKQTEQPVKKKKKKPELVFKPYLKGDWHGPSAWKKALKILAYYLIFVVLYLLVGGMLNSNTKAFAWIVNSAMVLLCGSMLYMDGARQGESETSLGEIAWSRREAGKEVPAREKEKCFHPFKSWFSVLIGMLPLVILAGIAALSAKLQTYQLQALPDWVTSLDRDGEAFLPLSYYMKQVPVSASDVIRIIVRLLTFPFVQIARNYGNAAILTVDRLSPLLVCLPALGYPLGYRTGPRMRAMVHGNIRTNTKRAQRRRNKAIKASRQRTEKKNELI